MNIYKISKRLNSAFSLKGLLLVFTLFLLCPAVFAQAKYSIDYYGIVADDVDDNMSRMTSDLYYTQLCEINSYTVQDKRTDVKMQAIPSAESFSDSKLSLYAVISKVENTGKWISTISLYDNSRKAVFSEAKEYDSFYKILMEPKTNLQNTITTLLSGGGSVQSSSAAPTEPKATAKVQSTEFLSGTWSGEDSIDKIVIMRGGRGFVIFKNGASMNITVEIQNSGAAQNIIITQSGKANASFFTEISRELALKEAVNAKPIKWILQANDDNTLSGIKSTLIPAGSSAEPGTLDVIWKRKS